MYLNMVDHPLKMLKEQELFREFYIDNLKMVFNSKMGKLNKNKERARRKGQVMNCTFIDDLSANREIAMYIGEDKPLFLSRYGATELSLCAVRELIRVGAVDGFKQNDLDKGKQNSGIFPKDPEIMATFTDVYMRALEKADMNAYWGTLIMEEYLGKRFFSSDCKQHTMRALEPFQYDVPWTAALRGKKVLVVHPFSDLIESQYRTRERLFYNKNILPEFELITVKAIQSSGETVPEDYKNWTEALDALYGACIAKDFDVALLSCGSYAVPLGAKLKDYGKQAIVLGGMMQLMFGIKGARWEQSRPDIVALYNDAWVRAGDQYKVKAAEKMVDGAAYW